MRITWPIGILVSFIVFAGFMIGFAVYSTQNPPELVADNYYELDSEYDQHRMQVDRWNRANPSNTPPIWENDSLVMNIPTLLMDADSGWVHFYKPDQRSLDFVWNWQQFTATNGRIASHNLARGRWMVTLHAWKDGAGYAKRYNVHRP
ncbi:MAG: FixH family protein [Bacteroidota bacterium]